MIEYRVLALVGFVVICLTIAFTAMGMLPWTGGAIKAMAREQVYGFVYYGAAQATQSFLTWFLGQYLADRAAGFFPIIRVQHAAISCHWLLSCSFLVVIISGPLITWVKTPVMAM